MLRNDHEVFYASVLGQLGPERRVEIDRVELRGVFVAEDIGPVLEELGDALVLFRWSFFKVLILGFGFVDRGLCRMPG